MLRCSVFLCENVKKSQKVEKNLKNHPKITLSHPKITLKIYLQD